MSISVRIVGVLSFDQLHPPAKNTFTARPQALTLWEGDGGLNGRRFAFIRGGEFKTMKTKTNCKAGGATVGCNHNETLVRDNSKSLKIKTALRAGTPSIPIPPPLGRR